VLKRTNILAIMFNIISANSKIVFKSTLQKSIWFNLEINLSLPVGFENIPLLKHITQYTMAPMATFSSIKKSFRRCWKHDASLKKQKDQMK
jgi:hypothetical protein